MSERDFHISTGQAAHASIDYIANLPTNGKYRVIIEEVEQEATPAQKRSLHLWCDQVAQQLNDAGYDCESFFKNGYKLPFSKYIVKDNLWRPIQKALTNKESTTKANKAEYIEIAEHLNAKLAEYGIHVPWPNRER